MLDCQLLNFDIFSIDFDYVSSFTPIDDGVYFIFTYQMYWFVNHKIFCICPIHDEDDIIEQIRQKIVGIVENTEGDLHNEVVQTIRSFLFSKTKKRPVVLATMNYL